MQDNLKKKLIRTAVIVAALAGGYYAWTAYRSNGRPDTVISGNGRIEATEIDLATKFGGRVQSILVSEGAFITKGQKLAQMDVSALEAQRDEAMAREQQSISAVDSALAQVAMRESDIVAAQGQVAMRESELEAAQRRLARSETLTKEGAASQQELDDDRARVRSATATLAAAKAQVNAAKAAHPGGQGLGHWRMGAPGIRKHGTHPGPGERLGQPAGFGGAAQQEDTLHA